ncbi:hypothetical protein [Paenibacillus sp. YPG26]|uniref:hypothetical protein n=1 Tax=Paenibacillus sp. YPG26 TaxID=2878915 RepID=UPI00203B8117|nr:hypothetical protein [Paenibacillus sp. YPG26]USB31982.1 hypothetical protein LDO05_11580 [Paenibacillus sp. YPG26]
MRKKLTPTMTPEFVWTSQQNQLYPLMETLTSHFSCRYTYSPSEDTLGSGEASQDYLAVGVDGNSCRFVVCDGVSLSYRGDFAAGFLGRRIFNWLGYTPELSAEGFERFLNDLVPEASESANRLDLPPDMPPLLRDVLEEKRSRGIESMYLCGRIELPEARGDSGRLWLAWQGDCRLRRWVNNEELIIEPGTFVTRERWSGRHGISGSSPHVYTEELIRQKTEHRIMLYTDGLKLLDRCGNPDEITSVLKRIFVRQSEGEHLEDDASWLDLTWNI